MKSEITPDIEKKLKQELKHQERMAELKVKNGNFDSADLNIKNAEEIEKRLNK